MLSRGVPRAEAERLLVLAFASEVVAMIPFDALRDWVEARLRTQLSGVLEAT